jgi:ABC-type transporter Mla MlaB component
VKQTESPNAKIARLQRKVNRELRCLILDFSSLSHIDPSGVSMLQVVTEGFQKIDIPVYIAACSGTKCFNLSARLTVSSRSHLREDLEVRTSQTQEFHSDVPDCSRCRRVCN